MFCYQRAGEVAEGGEIDGGVPGPGPAAIFSEGDIASPVRAILDVPVSSQQGCQSCGVSLSGGETGDELDDLTASGSVLEMGIAYDLPDLLGSGKVDVGVVRRDRSDDQGAELVTAVVMVAGSVGR